MSTEHESLEVEAADGHRWTCTVHGADLETNTVVVCLAALGVDATYYHRLAGRLTDLGVIAVTSDLRGNGTSSVRPSRAVDFGYRELVELDLVALVERIKERLPGRRIVLLGHSLGAQLALLYAAFRPGEIQGVILVASCTVYHRNWRGPARLVIRGMAAAFPPLGRALGYHPGRLVRFGNKEARTVMRDWSRNVWTGRYEPENSDFPYEERMRSVELPVLGVTLAHDRWAPRRGMDHLLAKLPHADVTRVHLDDSEAPADVLTHFKWARRPDAVIRTIERWLPAAFDDDAPAASP